MPDKSIDLSKELHSSDRSYGLAAAYKMRNSLKGRLEIPSAVNNSARFKAVRSILDYGTGKGGLVSLLKETKSLVILMLGALILR